MSTETKIYVTTEAAGYVVAGRRIAVDYDADPVRPRVGFELELTEAEAEYELRQGTITEKKSPAPHAADAA